MRLVLFDLDNTLLAGDSDYEWGQFLIDRGVLERAAYPSRLVGHAAGPVRPRQHTPSR